MTPVTLYDASPLGASRCTACKRPVYVAWDPGQNRVALDRDDNGTVAVSLDGNQLPWCRNASGTQLAFDEDLYRPHEPYCGLATVTSIGDARSARQRAARPAPAERSARAR